MWVCVQACAGVCRPWLLVLGAWWDPWAWAVEIFDGWNSVVYIVS